MKITIYYQQGPAYDQIQGAVKKFYDNELNSYKDPSFLALSQKVEPVQIAQAQQDFQRRVEKVGAEIATIVCKEFERLFDLEKSDPSAIHMFKEPVDQINAKHSTDLTDEYSTAIKKLNQLCTQYLIISDFKQNHARIEDRVYSCITNTWFYTQMPYPFSRSST